MAQKKYKTWDKLRMSLKRIGIEEYGRTATFLLDFFVARSLTEFNSTAAMARRVTSQTQDFSQWRDILTKAGYLRWKEVGKAMKGKQVPVIYKAGSLLVPIINEEKVEHSPFVTEDELDVLKSQNELIMSALDRLIEIIDPPSSAEKKQKLINNTIEYVESLPSSSKLLWIIQSNNSRPDLAQ